MNKRSWYLLGYILFTLVLYWATWSGYFEIFIPFLACVVYLPLAFFIEVGLRIKNREYPRN
jgi:hypothetical protein